MHPTSPQAIIESLLAELRYVHDTGDINDSINNSADLREQAARHVGYDSYDAWCLAADAEDARHITA